MKPIRSLVKILIISSPSVEEADKVIEENYGFKTIAEKIAFLIGMFDFEIVIEHDGEGVYEEESAKIGYFTMLNSIIKH